jgi:hypothetical protein
VRRPRVLGKPGIRGVAASIYKFDRAGVGGTENGSDIAGTTDIVEY